MKKMFEIKQQLIIPLEVDEKLEFNKRFEKKVKKYESIEKQYYFEEFVELMEETVKYYKIKENKEKVLNLSYEKVGEKYQFDYDLKDIEIRFYDIKKGKKIVYIIFHLSCETKEYMTMSVIQDRNDLIRHLYENNANKGKNIKTKIKIDGETYFLSGNDEEDFKKNIKRLIFTENVEEIKLLNGYRALVNSGLYINSKSGYNMDIKTLDYIDLSKNIKSVKKKRLLESLLTFMQLDSADSLTIQNEKMQIEEFEKATYRRWTSYNTIYMGNEYSFQVLAVDMPEVLKTHQVELYFEMYLYVLIQSHFFKVYQKILATSEYDYSEIEDYYKKYNVLVFKQISFEQQGIDLYRFLLERNNIEELEEGINNYVKVAFDMEVIKKTDEVNKTIEKWTKFAVRIALVSIIISVVALILTSPKLYNTEVIGKIQKLNVRTNYSIVGVLLSIIIIIIIIGIVVWGYYKVNGTPKEERNENENR